MSYISRQFTLVWNNSSDDRRIRKRAKWILTGRLRSRSRSLTDGIAKQGQGQHQTKGSRALWIAGAPRSPRCLCFCNVRWLIVIQSGSNRQRYGKNSLLTTSLLPFNVGSRSYTRSEIQRVNRLLVGRHRLLTKISTTDLCRFLFGAPL
jgi:hypothetical protein